MMEGSEQKTEKTVLTFVNKLAILSYRNGGEEPEFIADLFETSVLCVNEIIESRYTILGVNHFFVKSENLPLRGGIYPRMENVLYSWYVEQTKVSNKDIADTAREILKVLNETPTRNAVTFTGSNSWVNAFKARYGIPVARRKSNELPTITFQEFGFDAAESLLKSEFEAQPEEVEPSDNDLTTEPTFSENVHEEPVCECKTEPRESHYTVSASTSELNFIKNAHEEHSCESEDEFKAEPEQMQAQDISALSNVDEYDCVVEDDENIGTVEAATVRDGDTQLDDDQVNVEQVRDNETEQIDRNVATDVNDCAAGYTRNVIDLTLPEQEADDFVHHEEPIATVKSKKRKRPAVIADSSSEEFSDSDSESSNAHKRKKRSGSEKVLVPTRNNGMKTMTLKEYNEKMVIRIFKPVLKYAKNSQWSQEDHEQLNRLYNKSLKSCGSKTTQGTIDQFFRKKK